MPSTPLSAKPRSREAVQRVEARGKMIRSYGQSAVKTYDWPGLEHSQTLKGFTQESGLCTEKKGDVFVANTAVDDILEYPHGGTKPIATLHDLPNYYPDSCTVDPVSGDLAVTNLAISGSGNIVIFAHATGNPQPYTIPTIDSYYMCGYDDRGNLLVDGVETGCHGRPEFAMLPHGAQHLQKLTLDPEPAGPGGIQWDRRHWAIGDTHSTIDRFDVTGSKGTKVGTHHTPGEHHHFRVFRFRRSSDSSGIRNRNGSAGPASASL